MTTPKISDPRLRGYADAVAGEPTLTIWDIPEVFSEPDQVHAWRVGFVEGKVSKLNDWLAQERLHLATKQPQNSELLKVLNVGRAFSR